MKFLIWLWLAVAVELQEILQHMLQEEVEQEDLEKINQV
jgi:hypothetical protein